MWKVMGSTWGSLRGFRDKVSRILFLCLTCKLAIVVIQGTVDSGVGYQGFLFFLCSMLVTVQTQELEDLGITYHGFFLFLCSILVIVPSLRSVDLGIEYQGFYFFLCSMFVTYMH